MAIPVITKTDWPRLRVEATNRARLADPWQYVGCKPMPKRYTGFPSLKEWPAELPIIPREEWPDLIAAGKGSFLSDYRRGVLRPHDQKSTSRCWVHGSARALEVLRLWQGQSPLLLSPDSIAYPIEGTRDRGGYPGDACQQLADGGACPQRAWPEGDLSPRRADADWKQQALNQVLLSWLNVRKFEQQMTLAIHRIAIPIGLGWWGHLVCQLDPVQIGRRDFGVGFDTSWGSDWGENGYGILDEESATADLGAFAPLSETFSF